MCEEMCGVKKHRLGILVLLFEVEHFDRWISAQYTPSRQDGKSVNLNAGDCTVDAAHDGSTCDLQD